MSRPESRRWRFAAGLLAIAVLYTVYVLYFSDLRYVEATSRGVRHVVRFSTILLTYGIGLFVFARGYAAWLVQLWHIGYLGLLGLLLLLGVYDFWTDGLSIPLRNLVITIHELLVSPVPYVIAGLVYRLAGVRATSE